MSIALVTSAVRTEQDVVWARQRARQICGLLGFELQDQARIATAVSEIARNAYRYAKGGEIDFSVEGERAPQLLCVVVRDRGPGIAELAAVLGGTYRSPTGMGLGITGARRLMDYCTVHSAPGGTVVTMKKVLPEGAPLVDAAAVGTISKALAARMPPSALEEVQEQNRELIRALSELREQQDELLALNRELEDTNRGVVALYAELAERADSLRRADETKTRFLSNMSHEFRTPLNSIRALTSILLERADGPLTAEQELQVQFITKAADELTDIVNDLLDLAKIEAGKIVVRPAEFSVEELFSALRGMLRPLLVSDRVALHFEPVAELPRMFTDEGKLSQILRNFISNALKYTEAGEIRVSARLDGDQMVFAVADTGIGIDTDDQEIIFEEFEQIPNPLQGRVKGTGLGLPLSRRLASVLGGRVSVESELGRGSTFSVALPLRYQVASAEEAEPRDAPVALEPSRIPVLIVEDSEQEQLYYERILRGSQYAPVQARSLRQATDTAARMRPGAIVLDVKLGGEESWRWLAELKSASGSRTPVIMASAVADPRKGYALGADLYLDKPVGRVTLLEALNRLTGRKILVVDDDPAFRYMVRKACEPGGLQVLEAADAHEGLRSATLMQPDVILLDLNLPDRRGEEVLEQLLSERSTQAIPVVVATSEQLTHARRESLAAKAARVLCKQDIVPHALHKLLMQTALGTRA